MALALLGQCLDDHGFLLIISELNNTKAEFNGQPSDEAFKLVE